MRRIWNFPLPTISAVDGYALAGGFELSQLINLVVATTDVNFRYPIVRGTGTPPVFFLPFVVDNRTARELLFTGRFVSGTEAVDIGLANWVVEPDQLERAVEDLIDDILRVPSDLLYLNKRMMNRALDIMGCSSVVEQGHDLHITGHGTPSVREFSRRVREDGLAEALEWRDSIRKD